uniref:Uncharacterized protein n=1 Tax=Arundo donax TaxID=35708 RepID=A0A0A8Y8X4_ARUDO
MLVHISTFSTKVVKKHNMLRHFYVLWPYDILPPSQKDLISSKSQTDYCWGELTYLPLINHGGFVSPCVVTFG